MSATTSSVNETIHIENGERVYPCRCGITHRGDYGFVDWSHHNCFHRGPLLDLGAMCGEDMNDTPVRSWLICGACGQTFNVEVQGASGGEA